MEHHFPGDKIDSYLFQKALRTRCQWAVDLRLLQNQLSGCILVFVATIGVRVGAYGFCIVDFNFVNNWSHV